MSDFVDNPLNSFDSYSYNLELCMYPQNFGASSRGDYPEGSGIIMAKTGVTANYYFERLELVANVGNADLATNALTGTMVIKEPNGVTFLDRMALAAKLMGWQNLADIVYFLGVSFNGWTVSGAPLAKTFNTGWKIKFTTVDTDIDHSGSTYSISFQINQLAALEKDVHTIPRQKRYEVKEDLEGTLKEASTSLTSTYTNNESTQNKPNITIEHEIKLSKEIREQMFKMPINMGAGTNTLPTAADQKHYNVLFTNDNINEAAIRVVSDSIGIARYMIPNMSSDGTVDISKGPSTNHPKLLVVHKDVDLTGHDPATNTYNKKITHTVGMYTAPSLEVLPPSASGLAQQAKAQSLLDDGSMRKRYDYIFTGMNTEVIDAKLDFNMLWSKLISPYTQESPAQPYATTEEYYNFETQSNSSRNLASTVPSSSSASNSPSPTFNGGGRNILLEELGMTGEMAQTLNIKVAPIALPEKLRAGIGTNKEPTQVKEKAALAEHYGRGYLQQAFRKNEFLASIELTIRGDPYWFGTPNIIDNVDDPESNVDTYANYSKGEVFFFFKFNTPATYDVGTGLTTNVRNVMFSGVYKVIGVLSIFDGGKFTQQITGQKQELQADFGYGPNGGTTNSAATPTTTNTSTNTATTTTPVEPQASLPILQRL